MKDIEIKGNIISLTNIMHIISNSYSCISDLTFC